MSTGGAAEDLRRRLRDVPQSIGRLVPDDYEAYALVFPRLQDNPGSRRWLDVIGALPADGPSHRALVSSSVWMLEGDLDATTADALLATLREWTDAPIVAAMWEGYADAAGLRSASIELPPGRRFLLVEVGEAIPVLGSGGRRPTRWWPQSLEWCVAGDLYSTAVLVGGSRGCVDAVLRHPDLEAVRVDTGDDLGWL